MIKRGGFPKMRTKRNEPSLSRFLAQSPTPRFFAALSLLLAVLQVTGSSGLAKVGRGTGELAPVSRSIPILPRLQKEQT